MFVRKPAFFAVAALTAGFACHAHAQGSQAPFTIRFPPDGSTVKEKVRVEIPRASVKEGAVVAYFIDDKFTVALAPPAPGTPEARSRAPFTFLWDTKQGTQDNPAPADGEHTIRAVLYEPVAGAANSQAMEPKATSEVKVTLANQIKNVTGPILLRYKYREGENMEYSRDSKSVVVSALSGIDATGDTEMASATAKLLLGIEDVRPSVSLVRNKLTQLTIQEGGQEVRLDPQQLSNSMYQELDPLGRVHYETGGGVQLGLSDLGIPVSNTLELPLLPSDKVAVGDTWRTPGQRLDIPGMPPNLQPRVTLDNKLEGIEWEGKRQTVKIHQTYENTLPNPIQFGQIEVTNPKVSFDRVIYLAYKSGTLVKTTRTLTITGRTTSPLGAQQTAGAPPSGFGNRGAAGGGPPASMRQYMGGMSGGPGGAMSGGGPPASMAQYMGGGGRQMGRGGRQGMSGGPGFGGGRPGGIPGFGGGGAMSGGGPPASMSQYMSGYGGAMAARGGAGRPGGMGSGFPRNGGGSTEEADHPVTLKVTTVTELLPQKASTAHR